jgi:hypothetical protein
MTFFNKIQTITTKAKQNLKQEKKLIKEIKMDIMYKAKNGQHCSCTFYDSTSINNINYVLNYFEQEGFRVIIRKSYTRFGRKVVIYEW